MRANHYVIDASILIDFLIGSKSLFENVLPIFTNIASFHCPHLIDAEVGQVIRKLVHRHVISEYIGVTSIQELCALPLNRYPHTMLIERAYAFRKNATIYDGLYLALAEGLNVPFITKDRALANIPNVKAKVEVLD